MPIEMGSNFIAEKAHVFEHNVSMICREVYKDNDPCLMKSIHVRNTRQGRMPALIKKSHVFYTTNSDSAHK